MTTNNSKQDEKYRNDSGRFERRCGCSEHDNHIAPSLYLIDLRKRKKISQKDFENLLELGLITQRTRYICSSCLNKLRQGQRQNDEIRTDSRITEYEDSDGDSKKQLCIETGKLINALVRDDSKRLIGKPMKDVDEIINFNQIKWLSDRPQELVHLISALCNIDTNTASIKDLTLVSKIIELIYSTQNSKLVLPNHFIESLFCYSFTNCKSFSNFLGSRSPGGAYTYVCNWLKEQSKEPIKFPNGLVKAIFDNNQKVGKTYLISGDNTVPTTVITSHMWVTLDETNSMQNKEKFSPGAWMEQDVNDSSQKMLIDSLTVPSSNFRDTRDRFIEKCIKMVYTQCNSNEESIDSFDIIETIIRKQEESESHKICSGCGSEAEITWRVCRQCGDKLVKETVDIEEKLHESIDPYETFSEFESTLPDISCKAGEPDFIDPNGYHNVIQILQRIGIRSGIKQYGSGLREWLFIECDGLPYNLLRDIISNVLRCTKCEKCFYGISCFNEHKCFILNNSLVPLKEFRWLVPVCGLLHLEMNLAKALTKLNWDVFVQSVGYELGFKSPKAQKYLKKGADHHKLWHLYEIIYPALALELIVPYVHECKSVGLKATCNGYWEWSQNVNDPNYLYLQYVTLTQLHALMMFRAGVRKCNYSLIYDGIAKISPIVYARNHPIYQSILYNNARDRILMPVELRDIMNKYITGSRTNTLGKCQGGDAMLEELNKSSKSWLKMAGIPGKEQWLRVFRNIDKLNEMKETLMPGADKENANHSYKRCNQIQLIKVRCLFRKNKYLYCPKENHIHMDVLKNTILSQDLVCLVQIAEKNVTHYVKSKLNNQPIKLQYVYVTQEEKEESEKIENKTIAEIKVLIFQKITELSSEKQSLMEERFDKNVKNQKKVNYVQFYYELIEYIESDFQQKENEEGMELEQEDEEGMELGQQEEE